MQCLKSDLVDPLVGAFYYPWYTKDFHGGKYLRGRHLNPPQYPSLGEYESTDLKVIAQHVKWSKRANIKVWMCSWWGPGSNSDQVMRNSLLKSEDVAKADLKLALTYEPYKRLGKYCQDLSRIAQDIEYMAENYFFHPSYLKIDGKPAFMLYVSRAVARKGNLRGVVQVMREEAFNLGIELFIIGDHVFGNVPEPSSTNYIKKQNEVRLFDAITGYDVYAQTRPIEGNYAAQGDVDRYHATQADWKVLANQTSTGFIPSVSPGFNDRGVRLEDDHTALARNLVGDSEGSLFRALLKGSVGQVDGRANGLLLVTSFNEWHEDTQMEPVDLEPPTTSDENYTQGVDYRGYGTIYLDILRQETNGHDTRCCAIA